MEGRLVRIVEPAPQRVEPVCPLYGRCGGCRAQHMSYQRSLELKEQVVRQQLERIGGLWARGSIDIAYTSDDAVKYMEYQLDPDYIVGNHLFGSRYTQVEASDIRRAEIGGHEVLWGWYRFNDEYDRPNMYYVSVAQVTEGEALEILVVEPSIREGGITLDESYLFSLWELVSW